MDTRRYAKRQVTWFRNQMPGWIWAKPEEADARSYVLGQRSTPQDASPPRLRMAHVASA